MRLKSHRQNASSAGARRTRAMTLVETMIATGVFILAIAALISVQLFALKQDQLTGCKLGAAEQARYVFTTMAEDLRSTKIFLVGSYTNGTFTQTTANNYSQTGLALRLAPNLISTNYTYYYFDKSSNAAQCRLFRSTVSPPATKVLASYLTNMGVYSNSLSFQLENCNGAVLLNNTNCSKMVVHVLMEFWQYQYPMTKIGSNYFYNYYKSEFRVASHAPG